MASYIGERDPDSFVPILLAVTLLFVLAGAGMWYGSTLESGSSFFSEYKGQLESQQSTDGKRTSARSSTGAL